MDGGLKGAARGAGTCLLIIVVIAVIAIVFGNCNKGSRSESFDPSTRTPLSAIGAPFVQMPEWVFPPWELNPNGYGAADILDDGWNGNAGLGYNICSKSCCSKQYPLPFDMPVDGMVLAAEAAGTEFVANNYMCNDGWHDSGCLCLTKQQAGLISSRGGNQ